MSRFPRQRFPGQMFTLKMDRKSVEDGRFLLGWNEYSFYTELL